MLLLTGRFAPGFGVRRSRLRHSGPCYSVAADIAGGRQVREVEHVSELIGLIYDASLDPGQWPSTLGRVARFVPGLSATLFSKDTANKTGNVYYEDGVIEPRYKQLYFEKYIKIDPFTSAHVFAEIEELASTVDWMSFAEYFQSRIYREFLQPQGIIDFVCAVLDKSATGAALFGVFRHERDGIVDDEARRRMRIIVPHVRRAALIGKVIDLKTAQAATFADTLDGITAGMFLVDPRGRVVHANAAGKAMLEEGDVLQAPAGRLVAGDAQTDQALGEIFAAAGAGDDTLGVKGIALPLIARSGERYVAHVLPLTSGARRQAGVNLAAVAALFVRKAALERPGELEVIAKTYKLTPTELRVLLAVVDVGGAPQVAEALGVAETTVKFHLRRLFEKTGTRRQADLVKIVAGYSNLPAG
jgi:DNA-binding CsgD family transcriptional regulator